MKGSQKKIATILIDNERKPKKLLQYWLGPHKR